MQGELLAVIGQTSYCVLLIGPGLDVKCSMLDQQGQNNIQINGQAALLNAAQQKREKKWDEEEEEEGERVGQRWCEV